MHARGGSYEVEAKRLMIEPRDPAIAEPLQRRTYQAAELMRRHRPVLRHDNKLVLFMSEESRMTFLANPNEAMSAAEAAWPKVAQKLAP